MYCQEVDSSSVVWLDVDVHFPGESQVSVEPVEAQKFIDIHLTKAQNIDYYWGKPIEPKTRNSQQETDSERQNRLQKPVSLER